jgi:hypothetical protein
MLLDRGGVVIPPEFFVGVDARFEVMAAPGLAVYKNIRSYRSLAGG